MNYSLPTEIISNIFEYVSINDLVRIESTCRLFQSFALCEIEKRIIRSTTDEWGILVRIFFLSYQSKNINFHMYRFI